MQIHELTQSKKIKLDEIPMFGPGGLAGEIGAAVRNPKQALGFTKDGRFAPGLAQQQADQSERDRSTAKAIQQGQKLGLDRPYTLADAESALATNAVAQNWIKTTVAKWASANINEQHKTMFVQEAPVTLDPKDPAQAAILKKLGDPRLQTVASPGIVPPAAVATAKIQAWIDTELRTIKIDQIAKSQLPALAGLDKKLQALLQQMVGQSNNVTAQQQTLAEILALTVAANSVIERDYRIQGRAQLSGPASVAQQTQEIPTGLTPTELRKLQPQADATDRTRPRSTGNRFWDSLIRQSLSQQ